MVIAENNGVRATSPALIAAAWLVVIVPATWGLEHTVENALKIFAKPPAASVPTAGSAPVGASGPAPTPAVR